MRKKEVSYSKKTIVRLIWTGILVAGVIILTMGAVCFAGRLSMKVKVGLLVFDCILQKNTGICTARGVNWKR